MPEVRGMRAEAAVELAAQEARRLLEYGPPEARPGLRRILTALQQPEAKNVAVIKPLTARCPACLAAPGEPCIATSSDLPRQHPHRLRGLPSAETLHRCPTCTGSGWQPAEQREATDLACPVCEVPPGTDCTEGGHVRDLQHDVRWRAADLGLSPCNACGAIGWQPEGSEGP
jgi:hypothetical protein